MKVYTRRDLPLLEQEWASKPKLSYEEKKKLYQDMAERSVEGAARRASYVRSRAASILPYIMEESYARMIFREEPLDANQNAEYPIGYDDEVLIGWVSTGLGRTPRRQLEGDMLLVPTFYVEDANEISLEILEEGRVLQAEDIVTAIKNNIVKKENALAYGLVNSVSLDSAFLAAQKIEIGAPSDSTVDQDTGEGFLSNQLINALVTQMDVMHRRLRELHASPKSIADIREWTQKQIADPTRDRIFQTQDITSILTGYNLMLRKVYNSSAATLLDDETVYGFDTETFGVMPIRKPLETIEDPTAIKDWNLGMQARERIGLGVKDVKGLVVGVIDR